MAPSAPSTPGTGARRAQAVVAATALAGLVVGGVLAALGHGTPGPLGWSVTFLLGGLAAAALVVAQRSERAGDPAARGWFVAAAFAAAGAFARSVPISRIADTADLSTIAGVDGDQLRLAWLAVGTGAVALAAVAGRAAWSSVPAPTRRRLGRAAAAGGGAAAASSVLVVGLDAPNAAAVVQLVGSATVLAVALDSLVLRPPVSTARLDRHAGGFPGLAELVDAHRHR